MTLRRTLIVLIVLAMAGVVGWQVHANRSGSAIVVRYAEPPARGTGRLGLISCEVRVEDAKGKTLVERRLRASPAGRTVRSVRIPLTKTQLAQAKHVRADCMDRAGRTGQSTSYALAPVRNPPTRMASQRP